jgi:hypothetical protein
MRLAAIALVSAFVAVPAAAQSAVPGTAAPAATTTATTTERITGSIVSFVAPDLTVKTAIGAIVTVKLVPDAKVIANQRSAFNSIKQNDFVSTTAVTGKDGKLKAKEVRIFPEPLRGLGEGQYQGDKSDQSRINGTVTEAATTVRGKGGTLKLSFHGAIGGPNGLCSGHASAPGKGACSGEAEIAVGPATPVMVWVLGDPSWLEPGKAVSLYAVTAPDGKQSTFGVVVERGGVKSLP